MFSAWHLVHSKHPASYSFQMPFSGCTSSEVVLFSVAQSGQILCDSVDCSAPGFSVLHHLLELTQTHIHWVGDVNQPSRSLSSPVSSCLQSFPASGFFPVSQLLHQTSQCSLLRCKQSKLNPKLYLVWPWQKLQGANTIQDLYFY